MKQNKWIKIIVATMLSAVLMLCAVSCGDNDQNEASTGEATQQTEEATTAGNTEEESAGFSKNY